MREPPLILRRQVGARNGQVLADFQLIGLQVVALRRLATLTW
jgi:hypothetical protein